MRSATFETVRASDLAAFLTELKVLDVIEAMEEVGELGNVNDGEGDRRKGIVLHWSYQLSPAPLYTPSVTKYTFLCVYSLAHCS